MRKVYQKLSHLWLLLIALLTVPVVATAQDLSSGGDGGSTTIKYQEDFDSTKTSGHSMALIQLLLFKW